MTRQWHCTTHTSRKPVVLCDVDGVIADFKGHFVDTINEHYCSGHKPSAITTWDIFESFPNVPELARLRVYDELKRPGWCERIPHYDGAVDGVRLLQKLAQVVFVTSPYPAHPTWAYERDVWLRKRFGLRIEIIHTDHKHHVAGDVFIDDKPSHVRSWKARYPAGHAMLWKSGLPSEGLDPHIVETWNEVHNIVQCHW